MSGDSKKYYKWTQDDLGKALDCLKNKSMGINQCSRTFNIPKPTLKRHFLNSNKYANQDTIAKGRPTVFHNQVEEELVSHLLNLEKHMFGLTIRDVRKLAFEIAEKNDISNPFSKTTEKAGKKWFYAFLKRHPELSVRQPEATSLNRAKGFNRENVTEFFNLVEQIIDQEHLTANNIYNIDESGFSTVQKKPQKIVGEKGKKRIASVTSGERGVNTTAVCCASAAGNYVPPMIIFKRVRYSPLLAQGAPPGSIVTNSESGYINTELFVQWVKHFINVVKPTTENKVLLLLDGHTTHSKNLEAILLARDNGIILLQLPGHTTHRLQPLDVSFFKPFNGYYTEAVEKWLRANPGQSVTQYQISALINESYGRAASVANAQSGFRATGIWPTDRNIFRDCDFLAAEIMNTDNTPSDTNEGENDDHFTTNFTDQPSTSKGLTKPRPTKETSRQSVIKNTTSNQNTNSPVQKDSLECQPQSQVASDSAIEPTTNNIKNVPVSMVDSSQGIVRPSTSKTIRNDKGISSHLKIGIKSLSPISKQTKKRNTKPQKAVVLTGSPYKQELEVANAKKNAKMPKLEKLTYKTGTAALKQKKTPTLNSKKSKVKRESSISSDSEIEEIVLHDESDDDAENDLDDENYCCVCNGYYFDKKGPKVEWVKCVRCHKWFHETCGDNPDICQKCLKRKRVN